MGAKQLSKVFTALLALYFILSGLFKLNDPVGFSFQLQSYMSVLKMDFLTSISLSISLLVALVELILGAALFLNFYRKYALWLAGGLTLLAITASMLLLLTKGTAGCACYGESIYLPSWLILSKDLIVLGLLVLIHKSDTNINIQKKIDNSKKNAFYVLVFSCLSLGLFTINFQPIIDFSHFKKGTDLSDSSTKSIEILYVLRNLETREERRMLRDAYTDSELLGDTTWALKETIEQGPTAAEAAFQILDMGGKNYRKEILENPFYNLVIVAHNIEKSNIKALGNLNALSINLVEQFNTRTVLLTSSSAAAAEEFRKEYTFFPEILFVETSVSKSMVRANPGVLLMKNGIIIEKWHFNQIPEIEKLVANYFNK